MGRCRPCCLNPFAKFFPNKLIVLIKKNENDDGDDHRNDNINDACMSKENIKHRLLPRRSRRAKKKKKKEDRVHIHMRHEQK